ncbi:MAG: T9SS type A sorting domain-containing protein [Bacteroidota bacterium]
MLQPHGAIAIRDYWWNEGEQLLNQYGSIAVTLPTRSSSTEAVYYRYNTLAQLYNTGECSVQAPGMNSPTDVVLSKLQRNRYVWEIFGRALHLLSDMSVPAHTHKDMHVGNFSDDNLMKLGIHIALEDEDSYENWIGQEANQWWTAGRIQAGLIPLANITDPVEYLMSSMNTIAANFASDDVDGSGSLQELPEFATGIPNRHNIPSTYGNDKNLLMMNIRDNTIPYAIRAVATLMKWFVDQLDMPESFLVKNIGTVGYSDFYKRPTTSQPFPITGIASGTRFDQQAGEELSLRSHIEPHAVTSAKFINWFDSKRELTASHQLDDFIIEDQQNIYCTYFESQMVQVPTLLVSDEYGTSTTFPDPLFKNPWQVDPSLSTAWNLEQPDKFESYKPTPAADANGGIFLSIYDVNKPPTDYYSIRASRILDSYSKTHKWPLLEVGDYAFVEWENIYSRMFEDPKNSSLPTFPVSTNGQEYDTKIVDFMDKSAIVNANYKKHRTSDLNIPPTSVNSQRKVAQDSHGTYHAVYESSNRIWYVKSTDRGVTWSREERVSDNSQKASRPSLAAVGGSAWITFVADDAVLVNIKGKDGWETIYSAPITMKNECTPAIAVLSDYPGAPAPGMAICVVWEDTFVLRFAVINGLKPVIDNEVLAYGKGQPGNIDQPRFPSIAGSTMIPAPNSNQHDFHIAWLEHGSVFYVKLTIDRRQNPFTVFGWQPGGATTIETVHPRTGTVGIAYPARHAPSVAVTEAGTVHVAYDVQNWFSPWPVNSSNVGTPTNPLGNTMKSMFAIRERGLPTLFGPTWQTTATLIGGSSLAPGLCSPSVAAKPASVIQGSKSNSLRIPYNDAQGQVRVVQLDGTLSIKNHVEGWDPSMTVWASASDELLDVFSYTAQQPYTWHMLSSQNNLAKPASGDLLRMRQILLSSDEAFASLGIAHPRLNAGNASRDIEWNEAHDSLVIGVNSTLAEKMRTEVFTPSAGEKLLMDVERFGMNNSDTQAEILLRVNDAQTGEALRVISMPLDGFASAAAMAVQELDLSAIAGTAVFMSADVHHAGESWSAAIMDRYAIDDKSADDAIEKTNPAASVQRPVLKQNHPNPFNPSTMISYSVPEAGQVRLVVYNLLGTEIAVLQNGWLSAGQHEASFDGTELTSGVYIYRLEAGGVIQTRSMHLVK